MNRYSRQEILPEVGENGQKKLSSARILCVGAGGLGSPALMYLVAAGIGTVGVIDNDTVDVTNLHRQILFSENEAGKSKAAVATEKLKQMNTDVVIHAYTDRLTATNALDIIQNYDVVVDGSDNFSTKYLINDACFKIGKPFIYGSALGLEARVSTFIPTQGPCYRCLYPKAPDVAVANCAEAGVLGPVVGIAGSLQALEAIKVCLGEEIRKAHTLDLLAGRLWIMDARSGDVRVVSFDHKPDCPVCSGSPERIVLKDEAQSCAAASSISAAAAAAQGDCRFIDVREPHEWQAGHIKDAINFPLSVLQQSLSEVQIKSPYEKVILYCQRGMRSQQAQRILMDKGISVLQMEGGIEAWQGEIVKN